MASARAPDRDLYRRRGALTCMDARRLAVAIIAAFTAGCMSGDGDTMEVDWMDAQHAGMSMRHDEGMGMGMMGMMQGMTMHGPNGTVPMYLWNGTALCPMGSSGCPMTGPMAGWTPGDGTNRFTMHAVAMNGTWGMVVAPESMPWPHEHMDMMDGDYRWTSMHHGDARASLRSG